MNIVIKSTNLKLTEAIENFAREKVGALAKYSDEILEARVELGLLTSHQNGAFRCEVNLDVPQKHVIRAESTHADLYAAIDEVMPKLREQIAKFKGQKHGQDRKLKRFMKSAFAWVNRGDRNKM